MEILCYSGIPGSGKTLHATSDALKHFKKENNPIKKAFIYSFSFLPGSLGSKFRDKKRYYKSFPYSKINNIYSNYPILLDKKKNIYSNKFSIFDLDNSCSFYPNALFIVDEIQLFIDSDEYRDKKKNYTVSFIAKFMQSARHFGCYGIILCTQHPSRLFKKARNVASGFIQHKKIFKFPLVNLGWIKTIRYFILEDYGKFIPKDREARKMLPFEFEKHIVFMNFNKVFKSYDSRYLAKYNYKKPLSNKGVYSDKKVSYEDLVGVFEGDY